MQSITQFAHEFGSAITERMLDNGWDSVASTLKALKSDCVELHTGTLSDLIKLNKNFFRNEIITNKNIKTNK